MLFRSSLIVGVMTDRNDISTFVALDSISNVSLHRWEEIIVPLDQYTGNGEFIALRTACPDTTHTFKFTIDAFNVEAIPSCSNNLTIDVDSLRSHSFILNAQGLNMGEKWHLKIYSEDVNSISEELPDILDTVMTNSSILIEQLIEQSNYYVLTRVICSNNDSSNWSRPYIVTTGCDVDILPYSQDFSSFLPRCWTRGYGPLEEIARNGNLYETYGGWYTGRAGYGLSTQHAKVNSNFSANYDWLISPTIHVNQGMTLSFDLALTDGYTANPVEDITNQPDDRFIVIVSTNDGATWDTTRMTVWKDSIGADYQYSMIPHTGRNYQINLSHYVGENILIGFYAESTIYNSVNDLHLGNILIEAIEPTLIIDTICQGNYYNNHGFDIDASELQGSGTFNFTNITPLVSGIDSVTVRSEERRVGKEC